MTIRERVLRFFGREDLLCRFGAHAMFEDEIAAPRAVYRCARCPKTECSGGSIRD